MCEFGQLTSVPVTDSQNLEVNETSLNWFELVCKLCLVRSDWSIFSHKNYMAKKTFIPFFFKINLKEYLVKKNKQNKYCLKRGIWNHAASDLMGNKYTDLIAKIRISSSSYGIRVTIILSSVYRILNWSIWYQKCIGANEEPLVKAEVIFPRSANF